MHSHPQGGRFKSVRSLLVKKGIIESVTMTDISPEFADTKLARLRAHRLLKPYEEDKLGGEEGMEEEEEEEGDVGRYGYGEQVQYGLLIVKSSFPLQTLVVRLRLSLNYH